jgi:hypothetical protein
VDAGAGATPLLIGRPIELLSHGLCHAPAVGEAELGEHGSGSGEAEVVNEILPQDSHGNGVEQEGALPRETDHAPLRVQLQELLVMEILDVHRPPPSN